MTRGSALILLKIISKTYFPRTLCTHLILTTQGALLSVNHYSMQLCQLGIKILRTCPMSQSWQVKQTRIKTLVLSLSEIVWANYMTARRSGQLYWDIQEQGLCPKLLCADSVLFAYDLSHPYILYSWCNRHPSLLFAVVYQKAPKGRAQWIGDLFLEHPGSEVT